MKGRKNIKPCQFVSVWDGESTVLETAAEVDMDTKEVINRETVDIEGVDTLDKEYIIIDGVKYPVYHKREAPEGAFWWQ